MSLQPRKNCILTKVLSSKYLTLLVKYESNSAAMVLCPPSTGLSLHFGSSDGGVYVVKGQRAAESTDETSSTELGSG